MTAQYKKGRVQELVDRILPLRCTSTTTVRSIVDFCRALQRTPGGYLSNVNGYIAREAPTGKFFPLRP